MHLITENYQQQRNHWPESGKHIMAQYNDDCVVVYQAYRPEIGLYAEKHQLFGGAFSYSRMSWIKPNFLWMMYRSGWGCKSGQEIVLAIHLKRSYFDHILTQAVPSANLHRLPNQEWKNKLLHSNVRLQWDPDHDPFGLPLARRAIQLGLRGDALAGFKGDAIVKIENISAFVAQQKHIRDTRVEELEIPWESVYPLNDGTKAVLGM